MDCDVKDYSSDSWSRPRHGEGTA